MMAWYVIAQKQIHRILTEPIRKGIAIVPSNGRKQFLVLSHRTLQDGIGGLFDDKQILQIFALGIRQTNHKRKKEW